MGWEQDFRDNFWGTERILGRIFGTGWILGSRSQILGILLLPPGILQDLGGTLNPFKSHSQIHGNLLEKPSFGIGMEAPIPAPIPVLILIQL